MANFKRKSKLKSILCGVLVVATLIGACAGIAAFAKKDTKTISSSLFSRGDLDENGIYVESDKSIYTKEAFGCIGLRVEPDFESKVSYDVYYYDYDERLIEARKGLSSVYDEDYPLAQYARIVIHPEIPSDVSEKDFKINFYEVYGYANDLNITVDKKQDYLYDNCENLYIETLAIQDKTFDSSVHTGYVELEDSEYAKVSNEIAITGEYNTYDVYIRRSETSDIFLVSVIAASSDDKILVREAFDLKDLNAGEWCKMTIEVPEYEGDMYLIARMPKDAECYIFGYND